MTPAERKRASRAGETKSHLFPHQRRELVQRALKSKNIPKLAAEYDVTVHTVYGYVQKWESYQKLREFFADLVTAAGGE